MFSVPKKEFFNALKKIEMQQQTQVLKIFTENNIQQRQSWKHHTYTKNTSRSPED